MENVPVWMYPDRDPNPPETSDDDDTIVCDKCGGDIKKGDTYYDFDSLFINIGICCEKCIGTFLNDFKQDSERVNE